MGGRLVEHQHRRVAQQRTREHEPLPLSAGQARTLLPDERLQPKRQRLDPLREANTLQHRDQLVVGRAGAGEQQVLADRGVEDVCLLTRERERAADVLLAQLSHIAPADRDPARLRIEKAEEEPGDGRLTGSALADERHPSARREPEIEPVEHGRPARLVADGHVLQRHGGGRRWPERRLGVSDQHRSVDQLQHATSRGQRHTELPGRVRQRQHRLERGEREERGGGDEHAIEPFVRMRRDGERQHRRRRQPGHDRRGRRPALNRCVAACVAREPAVRLRTASSRSSSWP